MSTLGWIVLANVLATVFSIALAAWLSFRFLSTLVERLVCVSAGLLLTVALTRLVPEAMESGIEAQRFVGVISRSGGKVASIQWTKTGSP